MSRPGAKAAGSSRIRRAVLLGLLLVLPAAIAAPAESEEVEARARALEARLMAPCCYSQTVNVHESEAARQVRAELRQWLREGLSEPEVLARFAERYSARILAVPPAQGFNRWLYWLPILLSAVATAGVVWLLWAWRRAGRCG